MEFVGFDWDAGNRTKCQRHGVSLEEVEDVFREVLTVFADQLHSSTEQRLKAIGRTKARRLVLVVFTFREKDVGALVRPISARYMHRKEASHYEKEASDPDE